MKTLDEVIDIMTIEAFGLSVNRLTRDTAKHMRAALSAAEAEGWKFTPREATEEMVSKGSGFLSVSSNPSRVIADHWSAMHDASPSLTTDGGKG